jgi:nitroreductase
MRGLDDLCRSRRMCRSFVPEPLDAVTLDEIVQLGLTAPSAGFSQGLSLVLIEGGDRDVYWNLTLPEERRRTFRWQGLLAAPTLLLVFADPQRYLDRYSEADKISTGLGSSTEAWTTPYWTVDAGMAVMAMLLAAEDRGVGALFFALVNGENAVRSHFAVDPRLQTIGVLALGYPNRDDPDAFGAGRSAGRLRLGPDQVMRRGTRHPH